MSAAAQTQTFTYSYSGAPIAIPRDSANLPAIAEIYVPATLSITSVSARVQVDYPDVSDLQVAVFSARGTRTLLLDKNCGGLVNIDTTFADDAPAKFSDFCPQEPGRGPFQPNQPLANSAGEFAAGYWDLTVENTASDIHTGVVRTFSITVTGTPVTVPTFTAASVVNAASLDGGVIAPGELVTIYGVALGPKDGAAAGGSTLPTSLAGTTVTFNGAPAPILYSSYYQVNLQAPFTLTPGTTASIRVQSDGGASDTVSVDVLSSVAGLFTMQSNGRGQVLAVNQDGTVNSANNPAASGSYVSLYATGLGPVTPGVDAGVPVPDSPLSTVIGGVNVVIGGLTAPVTFVGLAPGYTGLYQINVQLPATVQSGPNRTFVVAPNGYSSQPRTFIQVQ